MPKMMSMSFQKLQNMAPLCILAPSILQEFLIGERHIPFFHFLAPSHTHSIQIEPVLSHVSFNRVLATGSWLPLTSHSVCGGSQLQLRTFNKFTQPQGRSFCIRTCSQQTQSFSVLSSHTKDVLTVLRPSIQVTAPQLSQVIVSVCRYKIGSSNTHTWQAVRDEA